MFSTRFTTARDFRSSWYEKWCRALSLPNTFHRKWWELALVCETLQSHGVLHFGRRGVGFGVGSETLPSMFADMGCQILATDLLPDSWKDTHRQFHELNTHDRVTTRIVDMNWIHDAELSEDIDEVDFDFAWSTCSMDHCGSVWLTKRFLLNQMNVLAVGGIAVHTAEYTISVGMPRSGATAWLTWDDIIDIVELMRAMGHELAPIDWFVGDSIEDHMIDTSPYTGRVHIKAEMHGGRWGTCVAFAAKRRTADIVWIPAEESEARKAIAAYQSSHSHR
jgi:hypothetical protein